MLFRSHHLRGDSPEAQEALRRSIRHNGDFAVVVPAVGGGWRCTSQIQRRNLTPEKKAWVSWWIDINLAPSDEARTRIFWGGLNTLVANGNPTAIEAKRQLDIHGLPRQDANESFQRGQLDFVPAGAKRPFFRG